jgi:cardiolipin synthase
VARTVTGVGHSIGAAVTGNRPLENYELSPVLAVAVALAIVAGVGFFAPRLLAWPVALIALWMAISFMADAWTVWRRRE